MRSGRRSRTYIGLHNFKVAAVERPKKGGEGFNPGANIEQVLTYEAERLRLEAVALENKTSGNMRTSMNGEEIKHLFDNIGGVLDKLAAAVEVDERLRFDRWAQAFRKAVNSFNKGIAIALADIWHENRSAEMGSHFREWADAIIDETGEQVGLPYKGREYLAILPAHWL